jgi:alpha-glucosidase
MPWSDAAGAGFTAPGVEPWLPFGDLSANVEAQRADPESPLRLVRDLVSLRRARPDLTSGSYEQLEAPAGAWAWRRGEGTVVALNFSGGPVDVSAISGDVLVATDRARDGAAFDGELGPAEGVVVALSS